ncbi:hypothetical protein PIB30_078124 [Stylosanthes scabra]|uniref:Uncharacterized protein n=1 Tax=Stylosanthes scabra TaxID=79078 RepID=A0ABU6TQA7_9FABA|nr:hypothetical protein [Stylosanthes scabra]
MGRPTLNRVGAVIATSILTMKFITDGGKVGVLHGDKHEAEKCHNATLHISKEQMPKLEKPETTEKWLLKMQEQPKPEGDLEKVQAGQGPKQTAADMPRIDPNFFSYKLSIIHGSKPVAQKLR